MNLLFWKNNKQIDSFASDIASELYSTVLPNIAKGYFEETSDKKQMRKSEKKLQRELQGIIKKIREFKLIHSLGVYGKARLHMKFRVRLEELGYDQKIASTINEIIMLEAP